MHTSLAGRTVLIVEDEPLIALDILTTFRRAGATTVAARSLAEAHRLVEQENLSAAVLDFRLGDGDAEQLCHRLTERQVPFVLHSGYSHVGVSGGKGVSVPKPATSDTLIRAVISLLQQRGPSGHTTATQRAAELSSQRPIEQRSRPPAATS